MGSGISLILSGKNELPRRASDGNDPAFFRTKKKQFNFHEIYLISEKKKIRFLLINLLSLLKNIFRELLEFF